MSRKKKPTKESIYDEKINPLMAQIIGICQEHKIPFFASFTLDKKADVQCTSALLDKEWEPADGLIHSYNAMFHRPSFLAMTIHKG